MRRGELALRDYTAWAHATFRHGENEMLEPLLRLEDEYDIMLYTGKSQEQLDQEVRDVIATLIALPGADSP